MGVGEDNEAVEHGEDRAETAEEVRIDDEPGAHRDLIVVGASAGGVQALQRLAAELPAELPASVLVVLHLSSSSASVLHEILSRAGKLPATQAVDGEPLERGHVYVAPPDQHMLVRGPNIHLSAGPRENGHRPAIDPLFRSAARAFGPRVVGVVLTGTLDDGSEGLRLIKQHGGATVVQDPEEATYPEMPRSAIDSVEPDRVVPVAGMGKVLRDLIAPQEDSLESTLWRALRTLEENADLLERMAKRAGRRGMGQTESRLQRQASTVTRHAAEIRNTIIRLRGAEPDGGTSVHPVT